MSKTVIKPASQREISTEDGLAPEGPPSIAASVQELNEMNDFLMKIYCVLDEICSRIGLPDTGNKVAAPDNPAAGLGQLYELSDGIEAIWRRVRVVDILVGKISNI